jgi:perosamine synthetase
MYEDTIKFIRSIYASEKSIPLHQPKFIGNEKKYLNECIDSTFVSSIGKFVDKFEDKIAKYTGANFAIATCNGTSALHLAFLLANVTKNDEIITQSISFVATCNAISYCGGIPIFIDVDKDTMGLSPTALQEFLEKNTTVVGQQCFNNNTGRIIKACAPMHTFGHPCRIDEIKNICDKYKILLIEDSAESLGSFYKGKHTGTFGQVGVLSFNGNKVITAGGGGCLITNDKVLAKRAKHMSTTAKVPHAWEYTHDMVGYNYRMPNLNAALLVAQLENLESFLINKRQLAAKYKDFFANNKLCFFEEPFHSKSNYWLNTLIMSDKTERDSFLEYTNNNKVMTRPSWTPMHRLPMNLEYQSDGLINTNWLSERIVNIPSSVLPN